MKGLGLGMGLIGGEAPPPAPAVPFAVNQLDNLALHWIADIDSVGIEGPADMEPNVSLWTDQVVGAEVDQTNSSYQPNRAAAHEKPGVTLPAPLYFEAGDYMDEGADLLDKCKNLTDMWGFYVIKPTAAGASSRKITNFDINGGSSYRIYCAFQATTNAIIVGGRIRDTDTYAGAIGNALALDWHIVIVRWGFSDNTLEIWVNGTQEEIDTTWQPTGGTTDNTDSSDFDFGDDDMAIYEWGYVSSTTESVSMTADERQKLEGYFAHFYGLTDKLPVGHPYKTESP